PAEFAPTHQAVVVPPTDTVTSRPIFTASARTVLTIETMSSAAPLTRAFSRKSMKLGTATASSTTTTATVMSSSITVKPGWRVWTGIATSIWWGMVRQRTAWENRESDDRQVSRDDWLDAGAGGT